MSLWTRVRFSLQMMVRSEYTGLSLMLQAVSNPPTRLSVTPP